MRTLLQRKVIVVETMNQQALLRICFVGGARYYCPLDTTAEKKFRALSLLGELVVIGFSQDLRPRRFTEHARFYLLPKLPLPLLRYAAIFTFAPLVVPWLIIRRRAQVLVAQSPYEGLAAAFAKKIAGWLGYRTVLVVESHGDFEEGVFLQRRILLSKLYRFFMRRAACFTFKHADALRAVSNSTRQQLERWAPGKPVFQFPTWTDIDSFLEAGAKKVGQLPPRILYAGVLVPGKGIHHLVTAFARIAREFPQASLVLTGREMNKTYTAKLKEQTKQVGLNGRVRFAGEMTQAELARRMQEAYVFVLPTYSEGLPRVLFEAMAAGLPVIASAVSGIPEIVQDGVRGFLVKPGDEAALAERLRWVLRRPNEAREMGRCARAFAQQLFSTEVYFTGYRQIFERAQALLAKENTNAHSTF